MAGIQPAWHSSSPGSQATGITATSMSIAFPAFANADGTGNDITGSAYYAVNANAPCHYVLSSSNGALKNQTHAQAFRSYSALAHGNSTSGQLVNLIGLSENRTVNEFTLGALSSSSVKNLVTVDVHIPQSGVLVAGQYQDTLTMTITPTH